jgi:hypothetical protein
MYLRELSSICLSPLRIAFDHLGLKQPYEQAVRYAHEFGLNDLSNYMLYNFHDSPSDLFERMYLNVRLNEELGIRIYSFPMRYQPTDLPNRSHIGPKWSRYFLRSVQIVLQATHGVVSGEPAFYKAAFGASHDEFEEILSLPHHMIFTTPRDELAARGLCKSDKPHQNRCIEIDIRAIFFEDIDEIFYKGRMIPYDEVELHMRNSRLPGFF